MKEHSARAAKAKQVDAQLGKGEEPLSEADLRDISMPSQSHFNAISMSFQFVFKGGQRITFEPRGFSVRSQSLTIRALQAVDEQCSVTFRSSYEAQRGHDVEIHRTGPNGSDLHRRRRRHYLTHDLQELLTLANPLATFWCLITNHQRLIGFRFIADFSKRTRD